MRVRSAGRGFGGRLIYPALVGCLLVGIIFVGVALASQSLRRAIRSTSGVEAVVQASDEWLQTVEVASKETPSPPSTLVRSRPVTLEIPAIDVYSALNEVGLDDAGAIETPAGARYDEAAWYKHSPPPGSIGPSIVLGHVDSAVNGPSVFFRLGELEAGDRVLITREDGSIARFTVYSVHLYPKDGFPTDVVYGDTDHAALRLITCGGGFDDLSGHYEDNIVVFAKLDPVQTR